MFPLVVTIVIVLGLSLVFYARQSRPSVDASGAPQQSDHWHHAYGFYLCDTWFKLEGNAEQPGTDNYTQYARTGIHSHDDGLIHWHPFSPASVGNNARLGVFLDTYGVDLSNSKLTFPESQSAALQVDFGDREDPLVWENGNTKCNVDGSEKDGSLKVVVWSNFTDTDNGTTYIADFDNIRLDRDQMVVAIAFVPDGADDVTMPPWAPNLPALGQVDANVNNPSSSIVPTDSSVPTDTTADVPSTTAG